MINNNDSEYRQKKYARINQCIQQINSNDPELTTIDLSYNNMQDTDILPIMAALAKNPAAAKRITALNFSYNQLAKLDLRILTALQNLDLAGNCLRKLALRESTALQTLVLADNRFRMIDLQGLTDLKEIDLAGNQLESLDLRGSTKLKSIYLEHNKLIDVNLPYLADLECLSLENNPLTAAFVIALEALKDISDLTLTHDYPLLHANTPLTNDMLDLHFKPRLSIKPNSMNRYIATTTALFSASSSSLPADIIRYILKYEFTEKEKVKLADNDMDFFISVFSNLPTETRVENHQLTTLINYKSTRLKDLIENLENTYKNNFTKIEESFKAVGKRAHLAFSNNAHQGHTECWFKSGFINAKGKLGLF